MSYSFPPDLQQQLDERLARGEYDNADDVLRDAFAALTWEEHESAAVMEAVEALDKGDEGVDVQVAFDQLRQKHGIGGS